MEQKFSNLGVMEAVNHSKNSAMEAENHEKHGASSKSPMSRMNFLRACFALLVAGVIIFSFTLAGCGSGNNPSSFVGEWVGESENVKGHSFVLFKDGTGLDSRTAFTWKVENNALFLMSGRNVVIYDYKISRSKLTLTERGNEGSDTFRKK